MRIQLPRRLTGSALCFTAAMAFSAGAALAQDTLLDTNLDFTVNNLSLEQVIVSRGNGNLGSHLPQGPVPTAGTNASIILQGGTRNSAHFFTSESNGSATVAYQVGDSNESLGAVIDSPNSIIAQFQLGNGNSSDVAIIGGQENAIATVQIGNSLGASVGLVNSERTTLVYGQAGNSYNGSIVIENAPPGTVITLD